MVQSVAKLVIDYHELFMMSRNYESPFSALCKINRRNVIRHKNFLISVLKKFYSPIFFYKYCRLYLLSLLTIDIYLSKSTVRNFTKIKFYAFWIINAGGYEIFNSGLNQMIIRWKEKQTLHIWCLRCAKTSIFIDLILIWLFWPLTNYSWTLKRIQLFLSNVR